MAAVIATLSPVCTSLQAKQGTNASTSLNPTFTPSRVHLARRCNGLKSARGSHCIVAAASTEVESTNAPAKYADFIDEEALLAQSTFPIKPDDLIAKAKEWLTLAGQAAYEESSMADDFEFVGPVVGPLPKQEFLTAIASFQLKEGLPDLTGNMHHFRVDPYIHNRVWFTSILRGTHTGTLAGQFEPTGIEVISTPQTCSLTFNEQGQVVEYTIGYPMDRRLGNTGGLGGVFGLFYAIGKPLPFPEANPWKISKRYRLFQLIGRLMGGSGNK